MVLESLEKVKKINFRIRLIETQINNIRSQIEITGGGYSETKPNPGYINSFIEIGIAKIDELKREMDILIEKRESILKNFYVLPPRLYELIYYRHVDNFRWKKISGLVGYSESRCYELYRDAKSLLTAKNVG